MKTGGQPLWCSTRMRQAHYVCNNFMYHSSLWKTMLMHGERPVCFGHLSIQRLFTWNIIAACFYCAHQILKETKVHHSWCCFFAQWGLIWTQMMSAPVGLSRNSSFNCSQCFMQSQWSKFQKNCISGYYSTIVRSKITTYKWFTLHFLPLSPLPCQIFYFNTTKDGQS